jgi:hypothetical protein
MCRNKGSVLLVALVFIALFALMATMVFRGSLSSVQALGNMQWRNESVNAANDAIDLLISDSHTFSQPQTIANSKFNFSVTGEANGANIVVQFIKDASGNKGPKCVRAVPIPASQLDATKQADISCMGTDSNVNSGLVTTSASGATTGIAQAASICSQVEYSLNLEATDNVTNTRVDVVQGVGVRVATTAVPTCN